MVRPSHKSTHSTDFNFWRENKVIALNCIVELIQQQLYCRRTIERGFSETNSFFTSLNSYVGLHGLWALSQSAVESFQSLILEFFHIPLADLVCFRVAFTFLQLNEQPRSYCSACGCHDLSNISVVLDSQKNMTGITDYHHHQLRHNQSPSGLTQGATILGTVTYL